MTNFNIHTSSLNGLIICKQLLICNSQKNNIFINNQGRKKSFFTLIGKTCQKVLNTISCGFYFQTLWLLWEIMLFFNQIIRCCNKFSKCFLCLKYKFNLMVKNLRSLDTVQLLQQFLTVVFMISNRVISKIKKLTYFYQSCRVSSCWYFVDDRNKEAITFWSWWKLWRMVYIRSVV